MHPAPLPSPRDLCCELVGDVLTLKHVESSCCTFQHIDRNASFFRKRTSPSRMPESEIPVKRQRLLRLSWDFLNETNWIAGKEQLWFGWYVSINHSHSRLHSGYFFEEDWWGPTYPTGQNSISVNGQCIFNTPFRKEINGNHCLISCHWDRSNVPLGRRQRPALR